MIVTFDEVASARGRGGSGVSAHALHGETQNETRFSAEKEVRAIARERVGTVKPGQVIVPKSARKPKYPERERTRSGRGKLIYGDCPEILPRAFLVTLERELQSRVPEVLLMKILPIVCVGGDANRRQWLSCHEIVRQKKALIPSTARWILQGPSR